MKFLALILLATLLSSHTSVPMLQLQEVCNSNLLDHSKMKSVEESLELFKKIKAPVRRQLSNIGIDYDVLSDFMSPEEFMVQIGYRAVKFKNTLKFAMDSNVVMTDAWMHSWTGILAVHFLADRGLLLTPVKMETKEKVYFIVQANLAPLYITPDNITGVGTSLFNQYEGYQIPVEFDSAIVEMGMQGYEFKDYGWRKIPEEEPTSETYLQALTDAPDID
ncbi:MAG: hypothetical protein JNM93_00580 [Bacteriovoracaceae bacterium]|nr:hypothetical protein [Bacteriovoracaceae bacterium]